jgi:hypothetical protein
MKIFKAGLEVPSLKIAQTAVVNQVWAATDTVGNGAWANSLSPTPGSSTVNVIQPSGDFKALIIKGNASQSVNLFEIQTSGGAGLLTFSSDGQLTLVNKVFAATVNRIYAPSILTADSGDLNGIQVTNVHNSSAAANTGSIRSFYAQNTSATNHAMYYLIGCDLRNTYSSVNTNSNPALIGVQIGQFPTTTPAATQLRQVIGFMHTFSPTTSAGKVLTVTDFYHFWGVMPASLTYHTITNLYGLKLDPVAISTGASATNIYGVNIGDITGATNNYAVLTGKGQVQFGDKVTVVGWQDVIQERVKAYSSQAVNMVEWQNSSGTMLSGIDASGRFLPATIAGTPTGTPAVVTMIYDTTAHKLWVYDSGWKSSTFS